MSKPREAGFAILEVLVAFVVAALAVAITLGGLVEARRRQADDRDQTAAALLAARLIAETDCLATVPVRTAGNADGLAWQRSITRVTEPATPSGPLGLRDISIIVRRGDAEILAIASRRLIPTGCAS